MALATTADERKWRNTYFRCDATHNVEDLRTASVHGNIKPRAHLGRFHRPPWPYGLLCRLHDSPQPTRQSLRCSDGQRRQNSLHRPERTLSDLAQPPPWSRAGQWRGFHVTSRLFPPERSWPRLSEALEPGLARRSSRENGTSTFSSVLCVLRRKPNEELQLRPLRLFKVVQTFRHS